MIPTLDERRISLNALTIPMEYPERLSYISGEDGVQKGACVSFRRGVPFEDGEGYTAVPNGTSILAIQLALPAVLIRKTSSGRKLSLPGRDYVTR